MAQTDSDSSLDKFERARESLWGTPGFQRRNSTITTPGWAFMPSGSWIVETIKTDDAFAIFLQVIDKSGGQRIVLPQKVCQAIYKQHESIMKIRRKVRAKRGAETRKQMGIIPFQKKTGEE